jgi:heme-degrading monooxygenase HmoA
MPFVSVTRLKVKSIKYLPAFLSANEASVKQIKSCTGLIAGRELIDKGLTFWTLTMWNDAESMLAFRNSSAHKLAMQKIAEWCNEASYIHWIQEEKILPEWKHVSEQLIKGGKITKVRNPSKNQENNTFPPIKWTRLERRLK